MPVFSRGQSRVVPCSCSFAASAHLFGFAFMGTTWAPRWLEVGRCSSGFLTSGASAGHPQKELKAACKWGKGLGYFCRFQQQGSPLSWHQAGHKGVMTPGSSWVKSFYSRHSHSNKPQEGTDLWHIPTAGQPRAMGPAACASEDAVPLAGTCFHPKRGHQYPTRSGQGCPWSRQRGQRLSCGQPWDTWVGSYEPPPRVLFAVGREQLSSRSPQGNCSLASTLQPSPQQAGAWVGQRLQGCQLAELRPRSPHREVPEPTQVQ